MDAIFSGFEQKEVLRYLRSVLSPMSQEICDQVENHAVIWGISGKAWLAEWTQHPEGLSGKWDDHANRTLQALNEARQLAMLPLMRLRDGFKKAVNLRQQVLALYDFLEETAFAQRLGQYADELEDQGDPRGAQILNSFGRFCCLLWSNFMMYWEKQPGMMSISPDS